MATIIQAITNRARPARTRTLVEVDEGHEYLGADDATERFLGGCYRKMRKYDTAMWMISAEPQRLPGITGRARGDRREQHDPHLPAAPAGQPRPVIEHFRLSPRAAAAFPGSSMKPGHFSDFLLMYGPRIAASGSR